MKIIAKVKKDIVIQTIRICVPVRYQEEQIPNNFPLRRGDVWEAFINIDTGEIRDWPKGKEESLRLKVCDEGVYELYDENRDIVAVINQDYVPHGVVPGEYGDYIDLDISSDGIVTNWPRNPDVERFLEVVEA